MAITSRYELKYSRINATSDGDNVVIASSGVARDKRIYVLAYAINVNAAGVVTWQSTEASPTIVASYEFVDGGGASFAGSLDCPAFALPVGTGLELSTAAGVDGLGHVTYIIA
jgi:hypothetical protein